MSRGAVHVFTGDGKGKTTASLAAPFLSFRSLQKKEKWQVAPKERKKAATKERTSRGSIHVFTGDGKGKTTASLGFALRALAAGKSVFIIQFLKGTKDGEFHAASLFQKLKIIKAGTKKFANPQKPTATDFLLAHGALEVARETLTHGEFDVVVLDEANVAAAFHLIPPASLVQLIKQKPRDVELIITGRCASKDVIACADNVVKMKNAKHGFSKGIPAMKGTEY